MANSHPFNFWGGEELSHMGATWFVSYAYYCNVNSQHMAWQRVKTHPSRISMYNRTGQYHEYWLQQVLQMDNARLNTNTLGLPASATKRMASLILNSKK